MKCAECLYRKKCELNTPEALDKALADNRDMLAKICSASTPRFVDEDGLENGFKIKLDMLYDVMAVIYTVPMSEYMPTAGTESFEEDRKRFQIYQHIKNATYKRCIQQANMRTLTLGRASCGFVGEYSSGKSSFLNAEVFKGSLLPVGIDKTTSIPTYIFSGWNDKLVYENMRGNIHISGGLDSLRVIAHSSKPEECPCSFPWNAVIKRIFCFSSKLKLNHDVVFVDLPGYSATSDDNASMSEAVEGCDKIMYFKPVQSGGLNEKDLEYLKNVNGKDVLIVLSKADRKSPADCLKTLEAVKATLSHEELDVKEVVLYTTFPEKFDFDPGFRKLLQGWLKTADDFMFDTTAVDDDLDFARMMLAKYHKEYQEYGEDITSKLDLFEKAFAVFIGDKALDDAFFDTWKRINKDVADSSGKYMEYHLFTANDFRFVDYIKANSERAASYYQSDVYDSNFNHSYQLAILNMTVRYLYMTALITHVNRSPDSNYEEACESVDKMKQDYATVRGNLEGLSEVYGAVFNMLRYQFSAIAGDVDLAYEGIVKSYSELVAYAKKYEQRRF